MGAIFLSKSGEFFEKNIFFLISNQRSQWRRFHDLGNVIICLRYVKRSTG